MVRDALRYEVTTTVRVFALKKEVRRGTTDDDLLGRKEIIC